MTVTRFAHIALIALLVQPPAGAAPGADPVVPAPAWRVGAAAAPLADQIAAADRCVPGEPAFADRARSLDAEGSSIDALARDLRSREAGLQQKARAIASAQAPLSAEKRRLLAEAGDIALLRREIAQLGGSSRADERAARRRIQAIEILNRRVAAYNDAVRALTQRQDDLAIEIRQYDEESREVQAVAATFATRARELLERWNAFAAQVPVAAAQCPRSTAGEPGPGTPGQ